MIRRPPRSTLDRSSAASDVYKRQFAVLTSDRAQSEPATVVTELAATEPAFEPLVVNFYGMQRDVWIVWVGGIITAIGYAIAAVESGAKLSDVFKSIGALVTVGGGIAVAARKRD